MTTPGNEPSGVDSSTPLPEGYREAWDRWAAAVDAGANVDDLRPLWDAVNASLDQRMTSPGVTLSDFLLARITEDERYARHVISVRGPESGHGPLNPERVIDRCAADRQIVELRRLAYVPDSSVDVVRAQDDGFRQALDETLHLLATPYATHPDYDDAWRP